MEREQTWIRAIQRRNSREAAEQLSVAARCVVVPVIGSKFVLYRMQHDKSKRKIELVKAKRSV